MTAAKVETEADGVSVRIAVGGEVDLADAATVESQIVGAITNQVTDVTMDFGNVASAPLGSPAPRVLELSGLASLVRARPPAGDTSA